MCIVLVTRNKKYTIILSNRDEFLSRPTLRVEWWPGPQSNVLSGRDLARPSRGTWLGITRQGRVAVLTNFREETEQGAGAAAISRGEITKEFLVSEKGVEEWIAEVLEMGVYKHVGGFSLMAGVLRKEMRGFAVVSNRSSVEEGGADYVLTEREDGVVGYECEGLSNSLYGDEWPKVKLGKKLLLHLREEGGMEEETFVERCFELLSYEPSQVGGALIYLGRILSRIRQLMEHFASRFLFPSLLCQRCRQYLRIIHRVFLLVLSTIMFLKIISRNGLPRINLGYMERVNRQSCLLIARMGEWCSLSGHCGMRRDRL